MSHPLTVNTTRADVYKALVAAPEQAYTPSTFPVLTYGESVPLTLRLITAAGIVDPRSGDTAYTPRITLTPADPRPTAGTFTLSDGAGTLTADYDISAQELQQALNAMHGGTGPDGAQVTVRKFSRGEYAVFWSTPELQSLLSVNTTGIQPKSSGIAKRTQTGDADNREEQLIRIIADPLAATTVSTAGTDSWALTLNTATAGFLRAVVAARGDHIANYCIDLTGPDDTVAVIAQGPVLLSGLTADNTEILPDGGTAAPADLTWWDYIGGVKYTGVETTTPTATVDEVIYNHVTIYRAITTAEDAYGYATEDAFYSDFDPATGTLSGLLAAR